MSREAAQTRKLIDYLKSHRVPLRVWVAPEANFAVGAALRAMEQAAEVRPVPGDQQRGDDLQGPAVMVLCPDDLQGPHREALLRLCDDQAQPGRPVICGGERDRDTLLDVINTWRVFRLLPQEASPRVLRQAVRQAHDALCLDQALEVCAEDLRLKCDQLQGTLQELGATRVELVQAERLAVLARISEALKSRLDDQSSQLDALERSMPALAQDPTLSEMLQQAIGGVRAIGTLLAETLALATSGQGEHDLEPVDLDPLVQRTARLLDHDPEARRRTLQVECSSGAVVWADQHRLSLVLRNLLRNAVQATDTFGVITLRTIVDGSNAVVEVQDTGCGMTAAEQEQLFSPLPISLAQPQQDLGLRLCRVAAERQGAQLQCHSAPGEGTLFRVVLRLAEDPANI